VIRLWNRVGPYRVVAVLLLVAAAVGGIVVAVDQQPQRPADASHNTAAEQDGQKLLAETDAERTEADRAARRDAQRKADEAAVTAAEQAKSTAKGSPSPKPSKSGAASRPNLPIPASCAVYTGNKAIGCAELLNMGFGLDQMPCLDKLWSKESGWRVNAYNSSSGALGIPQAVPGSKMASEGADYKTNAATQIRWGLKYIKGRYTTPCGAWAHSQNTGWY